MSNKGVSLYKLSLKEVFDLNLTIPDYQRIYCWPENCVNQLLEDCLSLEKEYRLGSIILHHVSKKDESGKLIPEHFDIIDGQQRLVTLTLLLGILRDENANPDLKLPLEKCKFENKEAQAYIGYNKYIISHSQYVASFKDVRKKETFINNLLKNVSFNVLVLEDNSRNLAYTFFSGTNNSKGVALTDYDLLKAHHLRYVLIEEQATHLAQRWEKMLSCSEKDLDNTLSMCLYRLRRWLSFENLELTKRYHIKNEYEAAPIIPHIPPFGMLLPIFRQC